MYTRQLLSLAAIASASASGQNVRPNDDRSLQASMKCVASGQFGSPDCCPSPLEDDGICTLMWCVDPTNAVIRDGCSCGQVNTACRQLPVMMMMMNGLVGTLCTQSDTCCVDGATNEGFNACMGQAIADDNFNFPDFAEMLGAGLTDLDLSSRDGGGDDVTEATADTPEETSETPAAVDNGNNTATTPIEPSSRTTAAAGTTEAPGDSANGNELTKPSSTATEETGGDGSLAPDGGNDANKYAISTLMTLIGASLPILFV